MTTRTVLFVYGTLKRGQCNHGLLAGQQFLGEAVTEPGYRLVDLGAYPGLVRDEAGGRAVGGELWAVTPSCLAELDAFEDVPRLFVRQPVAVAGHLGPVWAYFWAGPPLSDAPGEDRSPPPAPVQAPPQRAGPGADHSPSTSSME